MSMKTQPSSAGGWDEWMLHMITAAGSFGPGKQRICCGNNNLNINNERASE